MVGFTSRRIKRAKLSRKNTKCRATKYEFLQAHVIQQHDIKLPNISGRYKKFLKDIWTINGKSQRQVNKEQTKDSNKG